MDLLTLPAHVLRDRLRGRALSAVELLEAALGRIDALNPALNAVVAVNRDGARAAAIESDRRLAAGEARALEGLVVTVKDGFDVAGLVSTAGARPYRDRVPDTDAAVVARLRQAGAVILGKSNVPVFVSDFQTANPVYGVTNNPWISRARRAGRQAGPQSRSLPA
jgi:amidase